MKKIIRLSDEEAQQDGRQGPGPGLGELEVDGSRPGQAVLEQLCCDLTHSRHSAKQVGHGQERERELQKHGRDIQEADDSFDFDALAFWHAYTWLFSVL